MTVPDFFIPGAKDPGKSWDLHVQSVALKSDEAEALYEIGYLHDGDRYEVRVGEPRHVFPRRRDRAAVTVPMRVIGAGPLTPAP